MTMDATDQTFRRLVRSWFGPGTTDPVRTTASTTDGRQSAVQLKRSITQRVRLIRRGLDLAADLSADVSVNVARRGDAAPGEAPDGRSQQRTAGAEPSQRGKETR